MEDSKMEKINPAMLTTEGLLKIQEPSEYSHEFELEHETQTQTCIKCDKILALGTIDTSLCVPTKDRSECFFCKEPLTSDDFKLDRIRKTKNYIAHSACVRNILKRYWLGAK